MKLSHEELREQLILPKEIAFKIAEELQGEVSASVSLLSVMVGKLK